MLIKPITYPSSIYTTKHKSTSKVQFLYFTIHASLSKITYKSKCISINPLHGWSILRWAISTIGLLVFDVHCTMLCWSLFYTVPWLLCLSLYYSCIGSPCIPVMGIVPVRPVWWVGTPRGVAGVGTTAPYTQSASTPQPQATDRGCSGRMTPAHLSSHR